MDAEASSENSSGYDRIWPRCGAFHGLPHILRADPKNCCIIVATFEPFVQEGARFATK